LDNDCEVLRDSEVERLPDCDKYELLSESRCDSEEEIERDTESLLELISDEETTSLVETERESDVLTEIDVDKLFEFELLLELRTEFESEVLVEVLFESLKDNDLDWLLETEPEADKEFEREELLARDSDSLITSSTGSSVSLNTVV